MTAIGVPMSIGWSEADGGLQILTVECENRARDIAVLAVRGRDVTALSQREDLGLVAVRLNHHHFDGLALGSQFSFQFPDADLLSFGAACNPHFLQEVVAAITLESELFMFRCTRSFQSVGCNEQSGRPFSSKDEHPLCDFRFYNVSTRW